MATSSKDIETLWNRHSNEVTKQGIYIIDDRGKHGTSGFKGEWLRFGSQEFPNWESVLEYLQV